MDEDLRATVDHLAVTRLQAAYADGVTRRDWAAVEALFLPGAVVELDLGDRPGRTLRGAGEVVGFVAPAVDRFDFFQFVTLNTVVSLWPEGDPDVATARVWMCELRRQRGAAERDDAFGLYRDSYRRTDDGWRIAGRRYRSMARFPAGDVLPLPDDL